MLGEDPKFEQFRAVQLPYYGNDVGRCRLEECEEVDPRIAQVKMRTSTKSILNGRAAVSAVSQTKGVYKRPLFALLVVENGERKWKENEKVCFLRWGDDALVLPRVELVALPAASRIKNMHHTHAASLGGVRRRDGGVVQRVEEGGKTETRIVSPPCSSNRTRR